MAPCAPPLSEALATPVPENIMYTNKCLLQLNGKLAYRVQPVSPEGSSATDQCEA